MHSALGSRNQKTSKRKKWVLKDLKSCLFTANLDPASSKSLQCALMQPSLSGSRKKLELAILSYLFSQLQEELEILTWILTNTNSLPISFKEDFSEKTNQIQILKF